MTLDTVREEKAIENLTRRLTDSFADIHTPEDIETAVAAARRQFEGDRVRDYVPILVERMVRQELTPQPEPDDRLARWTRPASTTTPAPEPAAGAGSPFRRFKTRGVALPAGIAGVLVVATIVTVVIVRGGGDVQAQTSGVITVSGVIGSEKRAFFEDPDVKAALAKHGFDVKVDTAGSREIATSVDLSKYDFAFPSSTVAAEKILQPTPGRPTVSGQKYAVFSSPMAIATFQPIVDLLSATGIAKQVNGIWYFDVRKYTDLAKAGWRWTNIRGNTTYPVNKKILVTTTDPRTSNSAAMFLSIVSYVANHNNVVQSAADEKKVLPLVAPLFVNQGYTDSSSEGPFDDYLSLGMGKSPMVNIYEAQFVDAAVQHKLKPGMVLMYPSPTIQSKHTLVSLNANGEKLGELLSTDTDLQELAARHGFRTADEAQFANVVSQNRVPVAKDVIDVADTPTYDTLERLLDGVSKSYR
ncbi:three-helix bundle dimerization domain-containing protein [Kribbella sp. NPDC058693]|uniref:three-helix bundle dimerization domain-containing protein n=1 Tax=Kribbella sp. NPDC058693 TaxID=3346602 RepID=UPI0036656F68